MNSQYGPVKHMVTGDVSTPPKELFFEETRATTKRALTFSADGDKTHSGSGRGSENKNEPQSIRILDIMTPTFTFDIWLDVRADSYSRSSPKKHT